MSREVIALDVTRAGGKWVFRRTDLDLERKLFLVQVSRHQRRPYFSSSTSRSLSNMPGCPDAAHGEWM